MTRPCCALAGHPKASELEAALREGQPVRAIAEAFGVGKSAVAEHRKHIGITGPAKPATRPPEAPDASADMGADTPSEVVESNAASADDPSPGENPTRARAKPLPKYPTPNDFSYDGHVHAMAKLLGSGEYDASADIPRLCAEWNLSDSAVRERIKAGGALLRASRGDVQQKALEAESYYLRARSQAEEARTVALNANDLVAAAAHAKVGLAAQARLDMVTGVQGSGINVVVNVMQDPRVGAVLGAFRETLEGYPELVEVFEAKLRMLGQQFAGGKSLPAGKGK